MINLSIVVPVYGVEAWIERCLRSIIDDSSFAEFCELIIVDDGSPDRSMEIAERICAGHHGIHFIRQTNQGLGAARNAGALAAQGAYLWFVDSDDWLTERGLTRVLQALRTSPGLEILNIDYVMSNGKHSTVINNAEPMKIYDGVEYLGLSILQNPVQYYVYSIDYYRRQGLAFERGVYHEDALFTPIALYGATRIMRLAKDCYVYNLRYGSIMNSGNPMRHALDMLRVTKALKLFRVEQKDVRASILAVYEALAIGGVYYYWKQLSRLERKDMLVSLDLRELILSVLRASAWKYIFALLRMRYFYWMH